MTLKIRVKNMRHYIQKWFKEDSAFAATEFALIFPVLFSLLMGTYDMGQAMIINQKVMTASQVTADLIARVPIATQQDIDDAIEAGRLAMSPYNGAELEYEILSIRFDNNGDLVTECQVTSAGYNEETGGDMTSTMDQLANPGEGVLGVTMQYTYVPFFWEFLIDEFNMSEVAYTRGRKSSVVYFE
jgi:Flp pilus assembly protein TadG